MANHPKHKRSSLQSAHADKSASGSASSKKGPVGSIRIVAGDWRGRKIRVVQADGLRPTGDRVRETLFNWLQAVIPGSRCLDLFAGSGALGFEAASRGAASVTLVESAPKVVQQLQQTLGHLGGSDRVLFYSGTAEQFLATSPAPFDVIFVDPPFDLQIHLSILKALTDRCLVPNALLYVELPSSQNDFVENLPKPLTVLKTKRFGDVTVLLLQFNA